MPLMEQKQFYLFVVLNTLDKVSYSEQMSNDAEKKLPLYLHYSYTDLLHVNYVTKICFKNRLPYLKTVHYFG
jgi:hypothetical protein